jgi:hypothetical protein
VEDWRGFTGFSQFPAVHLLVVGVCVSCKLFFNIFVPLPCDFINLKLGTLSTRTFGTRQRARMKSAASKPCLRFGFNIAPNQYGCLIF